jgi:chromosome partitioning protein
MRQVISVVNLKGGVGKTTSAVNIAACWGEIGKKVLLIDLDPQGSASLSVGITNDGNELLQALQNSTALPVVSTDVPGVDLVPSGIALASAGQWISGNESSSILNPCLDQTDGIWDHIIIDCPPSLGVFTNNALVSSQHVFVPVEASFLGLNGLKQMVTAIDNIKSNNASLRIEAVIPCRAHRRRRVHWDIMDKLKEMFPGRISPIIRENVSLAEAPGRGKPVILSSRLSKGADDYRLVTLWLDERMNRNESTAHNGFTGLELHQTYN